MKWSFQPRALEEQNYLVLWFAEPQAQIKATFNNGCLTFLLYLWHFHLSYIFSKIRRFQLNYMHRKFKGKRKFFHGSYSIPTFVSSFLCARHSALMEKQGRNTTSRPHWECASTAHMVVVYQRQFLNAMWPYERCIIPRSWGILRSPLEVVDISTEIWTLNKPRVKAQEVEGTAYTRV